MIIWNILQDLNVPNGLDSLSTEMDGYTLRQKTPLDNRGHRSIMQIMASLSRLFDVDWILAGGFIQ